jgi:predicted nucleic acid-binding protein
VSTFVDTSALFAVLDRDDEFHPKAREAWEGLLEGGDRLVTSNYVLLECFALVQSRLGMDAVRTLNDEVVPVFDVHWINEEDHLSAAQAVLAADRRNLSLVDCASFRVLRRLGIRCAFTFDLHFEEQGFEVLPAGG